MASRACDPHLGVHHLRRHTAEINRARRGGVAGRSSSPAGIASPILFDSCKFGGGDNFPLTLRVRPLPGGAAREIRCSTRMPPSPEPFVYAPYGSSALRRFWSWAINRDDADGSRPKSGASGQLEHGYPLRGPGSGRTRGRSPGPSAGARTARNCSSPSRTRRTPARSPSWRSHRRRRPPSLRLPPPGEGHPGRVCRTAIGVVVTRGGRRAPCESA